MEEKSPEGKSATVVKPAGTDAQAELVDVRKIWEQAPFNAFTDLTRFRDQWYCVFREGKTHASNAGSLRVLTSSDGQTWTASALMSDPRADLRDPKLSVTPDGRLMLLCAAVFNQAAAANHQSLVWFSADGDNWTTAYPVGEPNIRLWDVTWHQGVGYCIGYSTVGRGFIRLYRTGDGRTFEILVDNLYDQQRPSEASLSFGEDDTCFCLVRREGGGGTPCVFGMARPPYMDTEWDWRTLDARVGGPKLIRLFDRLLAAVRLYDGGLRTSLCWINPEEGGLQEFLKLPSGGDTGYAGMVWHDGMLWVSYYASHEDKTSVYLARVRFKGAEAGPRQAARE